MKAIFGILLIIGCVVSGFLLAKGQLLILWQPTELLIIIGCALGSFIIANPWIVIKQSIKELYAIIFAQRQYQNMTLQLLCLLYQLGVKVKRDGLLAVESEIEDIRHSKIFNKYPEVINNFRLKTFIVDNFRIVTSGKISIVEFESIIDEEISVLDEELQQSVNALYGVSDSLPGFGIVAAVLGIVVTMQFINSDPHLLGIKIAAALNGTFLGVFLAYGFVSPLAMAIKSRMAIELKLYYCVKTFMYSFLSGSTPIMACEYARRSLNYNIRPNYLSLEQKLKTKR